MRLRSTGTRILGENGRTFAEIAPERAAALLEQNGARPSLARQIAAGALATGTGTRALAREAGLIQIETDEARRRGLLQ